MRTQLLQRNTVGQYLEFFYHENILAFALQLYLRIANIIITRANFVNGSQQFLTVCLK